jgi:Tfp pilus assembly protein PilZ
MVEFSSKDKVYQAVSDNFSKGGIFLKMKTEDLSLGDPIHMVILHPTTKRKFSIDAEVVHLRKGSSPIDDSFVEGVGIQFADQTPTRQSDMGLFLRSILQRSVVLKNKRKFHTD